MSKTIDRDAFGHMLLDYYNTQEAYEIIEREDGYTDASPSCEHYFAEYDQWWDYEREALNYLVPGAVLDLGCGAGRAELHLQKLGYEVTGIDNSPLAIQVCQMRGVKDARVIPVTQVRRGLGIFGNILMLGNNWGLMGNFSRARWLLLLALEIFFFPGIAVLAVCGVALMLGSLVWSMADIWPNEPPTIATSCRRASAHIPV